MMGEEKARAALFSPVICNKGNDHGNENWQRVAFA